MRKLSFLSSLIVITVCLHGQVDTVFYEDFQSNPFQAMDSLYDGSNENWVNYDEDGLETNLQNEESKRWYSGPAISDPADSITGQIDFVALSLSFLQNFAPGNRNWLILPPQSISDDSYMLHWESAPGQLPRYQDGYQVLISETGNNVLNDFVDTLFTAASMDEIIGDGQSTDYSNFSFTPGYLHANAGMDESYFVAGTGINFGLLEPHVASLAAYAGKTVYIAFLHDSDDDERIQLDDILITKQAGVSGVSDSEKLKFKLESYPNPVSQNVLLSYSLEDDVSKVSFVLYTMEGKMIMSQSLGFRSASTHTEDINLSNLVSGNYFLELHLDKQILRQHLVKR